MAIDVEKPSVDESVVKYQARTVLLQLAYEIAQAGKLSRVQDKINRAYKIVCWLKALDFDEWLTYDQKYMIVYKLLEISGINDFPTSPILDLRTRPNILISASGTVSGSALTKTDDSNVTLTLSGSPSIALVNAANIAVGWSGQLPLSRGGLGINSTTAGDLLYAPSNNTIGTLPVGFAGQVLTSAFSPVWSSIDLSNSVTVGTSILGKPNGGLGVSLTPTDNDFLQYKSGAWANRTPSQALTDLGGPFITSGASAGGDLTGTFPNPTIKSNVSLSGVPTATVGFLVGTGSISTDAVLEAKSTTKGFRPPLMTTTQRNAISTPTDGLVISNSTSHTIDWYNGSTWQSLGAGGGGIGGSTGSTDNAILRADGTGGGTVQNSGVFIDDNANITIGTNSISGGRIMTVVSSDTNANLDFLSKGNGVISLNTTNGQVLSWINDLNGMSLRGYRVSGDVASFSIFAPNGIVGSINGSDLKLFGGNGNPSNGNGGNVFIEGGTPDGAGNYGIVRIKGVNRSDTPSSGYMGEEINSVVSTYTNYTTTATYQNITSITLTAGDWDLAAFFTYSSNSATITAGSNAIFVISTTTASAAGSTEGLNISYVAQAALLGTSKFSDSIKPYRVSISGTTTYYLNTQSTFTVGNPQFVGSIRARRIR